MLKLLTAIATTAAVALVVVTMTAAPSDSPAPELDRSESAWAFQILPYIEQDNLYKL